MSILFTKRVFAYTISFSVYDRFREGGDRVMKLGNFKIGTRLTIGFVLVILLTLSVGSVALRQMDALTRIVNNMFDHPTAVGYAVLDIRAEINQMNEQVRKFLFASAPAELDEVERNINEVVPRLLENFQLVRDRYLGSKNDVLAAEGAFSDWKSKLDQEFELVRAEGMDKVDKAFYLRHQKRTNELRDKLNVLIRFSYGKAQFFLQAARDQQVRAKTIMLGLLGAALVISLGIAWLITRSITPSLELIVRRMKDIAKGDLRHDVLIDQNDEIGALANSFREMQIGLRDKADVAMAIAAGELGHRVAIKGRDDHLGNAINQMTEALQDSKRQSDLQDWTKTGKNELNRIIVGQGNLEVLASKILGFLADYLKAQVGTLYVMSDKGVLALQGSYAASRDNAPPKVVEPGEGLAGQAALEKEIVSAANLPQDYLRISSSLGDGAPRHIVAVPLLYEDRIKGVVELGSFETFAESELDFLRDTSGAVAIAVHTLQNQAKRKELLEQTQQLASQLQAQEEELRVANEELEEQTRSLKKSQEQLKQQQEELRAINEELEEKNQYLEKQKLQIGQKNQDLENARRELELRARELEVTSKYKSEFLANMSHELRTPLSSLLLLSRDLLENARGNLEQDQVESAGVIHRSGQELLQLINEILDLSKIEAGRMTLKIEDVDLSEVSEFIAQNFRHVAAQKGLQLQVGMADSLPRSIKTDRQRLQQILNNLVSNALKFTEQGTVTITFQRPSPGTTLAKSGLNPDSCVAFSVADTGIGIPKDKQMLIFEAFQQADGGTSRKYGGTGLGLSISRELAKMLGGEIQLASAPGQGSTFVLYLPTEFREQKAPAKIEVGPASPAAPRPVEAGVRQGAPEQSHRFADDRDKVRDDDRMILIVEDDPGFALILLNQCHAKGFKALVSATGEDGLALAEKLLPDAVILDIRLPGMSGFTVLNTLKNNPATRHIPVHIFSVEESTLESLQRGAVSFTTKPASREKLEETFEKIEQVVARKIKDMLIVEDNPELRLGIVKLIGDPDINITEVASGAAALDVLEEKRFDCMILDLGLPDMSGFELLDRMSAEKDRSMPPVIVYTGKDLTHEEEAGLRKHAESIIIKGVKSEERLLDEVSLFLHKTVSKMAPEKRKMIINLHERDAMLADKTILLVDDDMRNLFALSKILAERGLNVLKAEDGRKALALLESNPEIALVLLDIMMPVMDGYQTARQIRKQPRFYDLPIIALTAKALKEDRNKCIAAGANDYLSKPVDIDRLLSMLRVWLYRRECVL